MVIVCHLFYYNPQSAKFVQFLGILAMTGGRGVFIFFALSGFLVSLPFWKNKVRNSDKIVPEGYWWKRFWKVYPPLALSLVVFTPIYIYRDGDWSYLPAALQWLTGLSLFLPVIGRLNPVMWTLVVEVQFYLTLPLVFLAFRRVPPRISLWLISILFMGLPILGRLLWGRVGTIYPNIFIPYPTALDYFAFGILVAGLDSLGMLNRRLGLLGDIGLISLILTLLATAWLNTFEHGHAGRALTLADCAIGPSCGCLLFYAADPQNPRVRLLSAPWLCWCGIISYEWYLVHQPIFLWWRAALGDARGNPLWYVLITGGSLVIGIVIASLFYRCFSLPILRYRRPQWPEKTRRSAL